MKQKKIGQQVKHWALLVGGLLLLGYFVFHAIYGERGLVKQNQLQTELDAAKAELAAAEAKRAAQEKRVQGLRPNSIDPDLVEEEARRQLGLTKPDEKVIMLPGDR